MPAWFDTLIGCLHVRFKDARYLEEQTFVSRVHGYVPTIEKRRVALGFRLLALARLT